MIVPNGGINESVSPQKIKPNQWTTALNVEPLFDGVRRRLGSAASNSVTVKAIAESFEAGTDDREIVTSTAYVSQGFQNAAALSVSRVACRLKIDSGTNTGTVQAALYSNNAGEPGTVVTGADFSDFTTITASTVTSQYLWYHFTLTTAVSLTAATTYHVVFYHTGAGTTGTTTLDIEEVTTPSGYANGTVNTSADKATWSAVAAADLNFRIYSGAAPITMVADYRLSDASTAYHLLFADGELYKNVSGTLTALSTRDRAALTGGQNVFPSWAVGNDRFMFTNNTEVSRIFYDLSGTTYYENEGIAAPTATPTFTTPAGASGFSAGEWRLDYYYYNSDTGVSSDRRYNGVNALEITLAADDDIVIDAGSLPSAVVRTGDRATHIRIELMSVADSQTIFRFAKQITLAEAASAVTINESDLGGTIPAGVEAEYEHALAPVHKIKCVAENRQFIANIASYPYRLMFSTIIGTTPHYHSFPALNTRDFGKGDGDYITALAFIAPRTLIVGMKNSIRAIDARRPGTSDVITIAKNVGIAGPNAFKVINRRLYFLSDADENKGPYVLNAPDQEPQKILGIDDTYKGLNPARMQYSSCAHLNPGDNRFQWWVLATTAGGTAHDRILVYDYVLNAWTVYTKDTANILGQIETSSVGLVYLGGNDGIEYLQDSGTGDGAYAFASSLTMPIYDFGSNHIKKRFRWVDYVTTGQTLGALNLNAKVDYGKEPAIQAVLTQAKSDPGTWDTGATWSTSSTWGDNSPDVRARVRMSGRGHTFQPTLAFRSTKASGESFHLKGISFGFQLLRNKVVA